MRVQTLDELRALEDPARRAGAAVACAAELLGVALEALQAPDLPAGTALSGWDPHVPALEELASMLAAVRVVIRPAVGYRVAGTQGRRVV
jgi:hypothetical protein